MVPPLRQRVIVQAHRVRRHVLRTDARVREHYMQTTGDPKLHIGGGWHRLDGWLNTDIDLVPGVVLMDATKPFPIADGTVQFVFSEHMIEHLPREEGAFMLRECFRILRTGGVIRITTPDLTTLLRLYTAAPSDMQQRYVSWFCDTFTPDGPRSPVSVINAQFRLWGHQFLYDEATLSDALRKAGFHSVQRRRVAESDYAALRGVENTERYPEGLLDFESVALEAVK